jgi:hypothetical protein
LASSVSSVTPGLARSAISNSPASSDESLRALTLEHSCSSIVSALVRMLVSFALSTRPRMSSAASSSWFIGTPVQTSESSGCLTLSSATMRLSAASLTGCGSGFSTSGPRGIVPKYFSTSASAALGSMSPPIASVALFGPYQREKKLLTSSRLAAVRSSCEPIVSQW